MLRKERKEREKKRERKALYGSLLLLKISFARCRVSQSTAVEGNRQTWLVYLVQRLSKEAALSCS